MERRPREASTHPRCLLYGHALFAQSWNVEEAGTTGCSRTRGTRDDDLRHRHGETVVVLQRASAELVVECVAVFPIGFWMGKFVAVCSGCNQLSPLPLVWAPMGIGSLCPTSSKNHKIIHTIFWPSVAEPRQAHQPQTLALVKIIITCC